METAVVEETAVETIEVSVHLAKCTECAHAVKFQPSCTGASFVLVEAGDATYGIGPDGRPMCPNGHGEMGIADEQLQPVSEAFANAQAMLLAAEGGTPTQGSLPGVFPPFNFEGAFKEIVEQARNVERLKADYDDALEEAASAKKALDKAAELLMSMTLEFEPTAPPVEPSPRLVKCTWEAQHPDEPCPLCDEGRDNFLIGQIFPNPSALPPTDAEAHVETVELYMLAVEVIETQQSLAAIDAYIPDAVVGSWTPEDRKAVTLYADQQAALKAGNEVAERLDRPKVLGRPHVPEDPMALEEGPQRCAICNEILPKAEGSYLYAVTDLVGIDCIGKPAADGHHYPPKTSKRKAAKK